MSTRMRHLEVRNFRSLRGQIFVPLDGNIVLVHGENGAGKTSLLSAIELALTGQVQSLARADKGYAAQLLHKGAEDGAGRVELTLDDRFHAHAPYYCDVTANGITGSETLDDSRSRFFQERAFLPQSLLGQLLQIYQESGRDQSSPLAQFVSSLLGLDRLDALENGLKPLGDIRNLRKVVDGWVEHESAKKLSESKLAALQPNIAASKAKLQEAFSRLTSICKELDISFTGTFDGLEAVTTVLVDTSEAQNLAALADQMLRLESVRRALAAAGQALPPESLALAHSATEARVAYESWRELNWTQFVLQRDRIIELFPQQRLSGEPEAFFSEAALALAVEHAHAVDVLEAADKVNKRLSDLEDRRAVATSWLNDLNVKIGGISSDVGRLSALLADIDSFINGEVCPICDRDFSELGDGPLKEHVHRKAAGLSDSTRQLMKLANERATIQKELSSIDGEIANLKTEKLSDVEYGQVRDRPEVIAGVHRELNGMRNDLYEGGRLSRAAVETANRLAEVQSHDAATRAAVNSVLDFGLSIGFPLADDEAVSVDTVVQLYSFLLGKRNLASERQEKMAAAQALIGSIRETQVAHTDLTASAEALLQDIQSQARALARGEALRTQANNLRSAVDVVRSNIIRHEFNERLNRVWRDLFVRLAPKEPFVPAFRILTSNTQQLKPQLITTHRDGGDVAGSPGAMLSAGNLNTAALTLFLALHLSVPAELPWLILDDPVQSMDDVHISHFAALLRTLAREHDKQIVIAVHERQLFDYLTLELSPAYAEDSLITVELSRSPTRDSECKVTRHVYHDDPILRAVA